MKFSVGYQLREDNILTDAITESVKSIDEIYFSWENFANGRSRGFMLSNMTKDAATAKRDADFDLFLKNGLKFNLLLNGNCYGKDALAREFFYKVGDAVDFLKDKYRLSTVTTTSPVIAKFIKTNFPDVTVRASVNMEIGTVEGIDYLAEVFDSFYLKREYNRDFEKIKAIRDFCDKNNKSLYGLANSGCLNYCSAHTFHDNLVSHEDEILKQDNAFNFEGQCYTYLKNSQKRENWLAITNFIRPEDVPLYESLFDGLKLATRVSRSPGRIIRAYATGGFSGPVTDLLEPNHSGLFYPTVIENKNIPNDFATTVGGCKKNCLECGYCKQVLKNASIFLS